MVIKLVEWQMKGYLIVFVYLVFKGVQKVIDFMIEMLNVYQMYKQINEDGIVKYVLLCIGDMVVMVIDVNDEYLV